MVVKQEIVSAEEEEDTQTTTTEDDVNEVIPENDVDQDEVSQEEDVPQEQKQGQKRRRDTISNWHCTYCHAGYKTKNGVYHHIIRPSTKCNQIHAISGMKAVWEDEQADREKKFRCGICNKGFRSSESLRVHNYNYHK
jgi:hypothetical protein